MATLKWNGKQILKQVRRASVAAVNAVSSDAADELRQAARVRTGRLKSSIQERPARVVGTTVEGGVDMPFYGTMGANRKAYLEAKRRTRQKLPGELRKAFRAETGPGVLHGPQGRHVTSEKSLDKVG